MATTKLATLIIRTLAKPISNTIKQQCKEHERFRGLCISFAQSTHRAEVKLRTGLLGDSPKNIRPLSEARAIESGANAIAEGFLFAVAAGLILGESWRTSRNQAKRRDAVDDTMEDLTKRVEVLTENVKELRSQYEEQWEIEKSRNEELARVLNQVVDVGIRGGLIELKETPLRLHEPSSPSDSPHPKSTT